ncbi:MAG: hypothetical protein VKK32_00855 [Candidatus Melainabacteria bacterium]|nr:hypothetical protein [Candidatus Melainabacteria bacterium]
MVITSSATAQRYQDTVYSPDTGITRKRVLPWSPDATKALVGDDNNLATSYVERSALNRETGIALPLPNGATVTTKIAEIRNEGHSEISHTLKFPINPTKTVHDRVPSPEVIVSSHRNQLIENPNPIAPRMIVILNDESKNASEKIVLLMEEGLINFEEIDKIRQHFLAKQAEQTGKPNLQDKMAKAQTFSDFNNILESTKLNDAQKFSQIQERQMFPELVNAAVKKANDEYPIESERSHPYYVMIIDELKEQYSIKNQEYEKAQVAKLEENNRAITDSMLEMLKTSKLQRTLKLSSYTPEEKLEIINREKLMPEEELAALNEEAKRMKPEAVVNSLVKKAEYGTRQITSSLGGINSASKFDKSSGDAFPVLTSKIIYLGDPKAADTTSISIKWNSPNFDEETKSFTQKALELFKIDHTKPEESFDHVMKLLVEELNPPSAFNPVKLQGRSRANKITEEAFKSGNVSEFKTAMSSLFELYKNDAKNPKQFEQLFKLAEKHLTNIIINGEADQKNTIQLPEVSTKDSPEKVVSDQIKAYAAEKDKISSKLQQLDTLEASEIALSTSNIVKNLYEDLDKPTQNNSKEEYDNLQLVLSKLKFIINDNPDKLMKRDLRQEVIDAQNAVNTAMEKFAEKVIPDDPILRERFSEKLTTIQEQEWAASIKRQEKILKSSGLPEYQSNQAILEKYGQMGDLMSIIQAASPQGTSLEISINEGNVEISRFTFSPDASIAAPARTVRIGEFNIPIPGAPGSPAGSHTDRSGNNIRVENGFVIISDKENHTKRLITPQGTDIEFYPKGTPHKPLLEEKYMASNRIGNSAIAAEPGNSALKKNLAALQRRTGVSGGLSKATTNNSTPVSSIQTKYGDVFGMDSMGFYTFETRNNGKFVAYDADPNRTKNYNFNAPKTTLFDI